MIYRKYPIRSLLTSMLRKANIRYPSDVYSLSFKKYKGSKYGEFLKDKNVLLCSRLYKYAPNLESLLTQPYVYVMCTLWSDNTCVFTRFHSVKNANTQLIWSLIKAKKSPCCVLKYVNKHSFLLPQVYSLSLIPKTRTNSPFSLQISRLSM